jgi:branched-chain amino acid transport system ATP-binding protein
MTPLLEVRHVVAGFGATTVLHGLTYNVEPGEIAGIFGLNGAGKSVSMKVLAGIVPVRDGKVFFGGVDVTSAPAEARVRLGMGHVPQGRQVFARLSVEQNLRLGAYPLRRRSPRRYAEVLAGVYDRFPVLARRRDQLAGTMSGGEQASLSVARALMSEPRLLLVDEPSAGLAPIIVQELFTTLREVAASGVTMVLVEQNVRFGLQLADTAHILQTGRIVHSGPVDALDDAVLASHLGVGRLLGSGVSSTLQARRPVAPAAKRAPAARKPAKKLGSSSARKVTAKKVTAKKAVPAAKKVTAKKVTAKKPAKRAGGAS